MDTNTKRRRAGLGTATWWLAASLAGTYAFPASEATASCTQPIYIIAHRCNDPNDGPITVQQEGVNAIEADFSWGSRAFVDDTGHDDEWAVDHDGVFPHSTYLSNWLFDVAAEVNRPGTPLSLIIVDIKDPDGDLLDLYATIRGALGPDINLLFSMADFSQGWRFGVLKDALNADEHAAAAIDELPNATPQQVQTLFVNLGITRYWIGDGICAACAEPERIDNNVTAAIKIRDSVNDCGGFHGVYTWTYESESAIEHYLQRGVNGIFVNASTCNGYASPLTATAPKEVVAYAKTLPGRKFADPWDNPFDMRPEMVCPADLRLDCPAPGGIPADDPRLASFLDGVACTSGFCDPITVSDNAYLFPIGTTDVVFKASVGGTCDPTSTCTARVSVEADTEAPSIQCPAPIVVNATAPGGAIVSYVVGLGDNCPGSTIACTPSPGSLVPQGVHVLACTATDPSQNQGSCSTTIHVKTGMEQVRDLQGELARLPMPADLYADLSTQLTEAILHLSSPNLREQRQACDDLLAFAKGVGKAADTGDILPPDAKKLIGGAANIRTVLSCSESRWLISWLLNH